MSPGSKKKRLEKESFFREQLLLNDLIKLEAYIKAFWQFLPIAVCYVNPAFNILEASKTLEVLLNCTIMEIIGHNLKEFFPREFDFEALEKEIKEKKKITQKEIELLRKDKKRILVSVFALSRIEDRVLMGYFFAFLDITERKKMEKELRERIEELERFQKLTVGRELKMVELKQALKKAQKEILELRKKLSQKAKTQ